MSIKSFLSVAFLGASMSLFAQTHSEGVEYYKADQFSNAKELLTRNLNNSGTDKAISDYYLGMIALNEGNDQEAEKYFNDGLAANPENGYNYVGLGTIQLKKGDVKAAEQLFKEGEGKDKKDYSLQIAIARAYDMADPQLYADKINKRVEKVRSKDIKNPDLYLFEGDQLAEQKDFGGAAAKYEMAASYDPQATEAYVKYANLFTMVNPKYAITKLNELLQLNPTSALAQRELANAYYNNKDYKEAANQYGKYVTNPSHFKQDEDRYAFLLFYGGDYKKGYDYSTQLLQNNPGHFTAQRFQFMNAAQLPELKDQLLPMAETLYSAHQANPADNKLAPIDYTLIADELKTAGRVDDAVNVINEAIANDPTNANFSKQLANLYVEENDISKASDAYHDYLTKTEEPGYNDFVQQALYAYFAGRQNLLDNPEESKRFFGVANEYANKAKDMAPNQYKPVKILADVAIASAPTEDEMKSAGQPLYEEAIVLLEGSQDPSRYKSDAKEIYNYLGNYYLDQKDVAKAKEYFNKYLELDPDNADYRKFVESLK